MFIPRNIISLLTFPGIILKNISYKMMCKIYKREVFEVSYFSLENEGRGYVSYSMAERNIDNILFYLSSFFMNTIIGMLTGMPTAILMVSERRVDVFTLTLLWLSISIVMNAFPDEEDSELIWKMTDIKEIGLVKSILIYPITGFIKMASVLTWTLFDLFYAVFLIILTPNLINELIK